MNESVALAQSLISLGILALLWLGPVARLRRDNFRSKIRWIRDGLFDFMYKNGYDFSTEAYQATRQMLNGMVRASNYFSVPVFILNLSFAIKNRRPRTPSAMDEIQKLLDGQLKDELLRVSDQAMREMLKFIFIRRISGLLTVALLAVIYGMYFAFKWLTRSNMLDKLHELVNRPANHLLDDAYEFGSPTPSPFIKGILKPYTTTTRKSAVVSQ